MPRPVLRVSAARFTGPCASSCQTESQLEQRYTPGVRRWIRSIVERRKSISGKLGVAGYIAVRKEGTWTASGARVRQRFRGKSSVKWRWRRHVAAAEAARTFPKTSPTRTRRQTPAISSLSATPAARATWRASICLCSSPRSTPLPGATHGFTPEPCIYSSVTAVSSHFFQPCWKVSKITSLGETAPGSIHAIFSLKLLFL